MPLGRAVGIEGDEAADLARRVRQEDRAAGA